MAQMMVSPKISVITATYNSEQHLEQTILSVARQDYKNVEHIIIDGGSNDGTKEIINKYRNYLSRVISEPDLGVYDAFNKGLAQATGDVVYFLNSDDYLLASDIFTKVIVAFSNNPQTLGVYGKIIYRSDNMDLWEPMQLEPLTIEHVKRGELPPHPAFFAKRELYDKIGGFNLNYKIAADTDFMVRAFKLYPDDFLFIDLWFTAHRRGGLSTHLKGFDLVRSELADLLNRHFGIKYNFHSEAVKLNSYYRKWLEQIFFNNKGVTGHLTELGVRKVAILGANHTGMYLVKDLQLSGIEVVTFLEGNSPLNGNRMQGIPVNHLSWLDSNSQQIDTIIIALNDEQSYKHLRQFAAELRLQVFNWRDIIAALE